MVHWFVRSWLAAVFLLAAPAWSQGMDAQAREKIWAEARAAAQAGPQTIGLAGQAQLQVPADHVFIPQPHATRVLQAMGNPGNDDRLQGLVFPTGDAQWFMTIRFESAGYVRDDDAKDWNADELLTSYREGTEASNAERVKLGVPALEVLGWAEKPAYDSSTHRLVWAMSMRDKDAPANAAQGVNYNTYALGREGYFSMNLVTDLDALPAHKGFAHTLINALQYDEGKRYADFNSSTDKVAEYGLAALVLGAGAKKLGLFAVAAAFLAKFAKLGLLALLGLGALVMKLFRRKPAQS